MSLVELIARATERNPTAPAVRGSDGALDYGALHRAAGQVARALADRGVRAGDRVGLWAEKGARTVAALHGTMHIGAAYVPIDPQGPALRARQILADAGARAVVTTRERAAALAALGLDLPSLLVEEWAAIDALPEAPPASPGAGDLAYVLYTSGSTGQPKGVALSHGNARAFVDWSAAEVGLAPGDRLSSHAPFHFDLSVFDLHAAAFAGAEVRLVPEAAAYAPRRLVDFLVGEAISVWYSVPSALVLMMEHGGLLERAAPSLRALIFAGEVFPPKHLARLRRHLAAPRMWNWYGPTETNVCTSYELGATVDEATPLPIGSAACGDRVWIGDERGAPLSDGAEGALWVAGPTVMQGYFGGEPQAGRPYDTGDVVRRDDGGELRYVGRRDHLVKVRGVRIEPGEIEAALLAHPAIRAAAVVVRGAGAEARLVAFLVAAPAAPSLLELKRHLAERLPRSMIVDEAVALDALPRTANGKTDRLALTRRAQES